VTRIRRTKVLLACRFARRSGRQLDCRCQNHPPSGGNSSHCGTFERALRQVVAAQATATRGQTCFGASGQSHRDTTRWRPIAQANGAKSVASMPFGTQAAEVDSVGVHAFAAGNVWTRDLDVDPTKSLPEKEVETFWVSVRCGGSRRFVTVSTVRVRP